MWQLLFWQKIFDDANLRERKVCSKQLSSSVDLLHCPVYGKFLASSRRVGTGRPALHLRT